MAAGRCHLAHKSGCKDRWFVVEDCGARLRLLGVFHVSRCLRKAYGDYGCPQKTWKVRRPGARRDGRRRDCGGRGPVAAGGAAAAEAGGAGLAMTVGIPALIAAAVTAAVAALGWASCIQRRRARMPRKSKTRPKELRGGWRIRLQLLLGGSHRRLQRNGTIFRVRSSRLSRLPAASLSMSSRPSCTFQVWSRRGSIRWPNTGPVCSDQGSCWGCR